MGRLEVVDVQAEKADDTVLVVPEHEGPGAEAPLDPFIVDSGRFRNLGWGDRLAFGQEVIGLH
jgi:hypothetical protein